MLIRSFRMFRFICLDFINKGNAMKTVFIRLFRERCIAYDYIKYPVFNILYCNI